TSMWRPMAQWLRLRPADADKFPESCWKLLFYLAIWLYAAHLLVKEEYPFYHNPAAVFYDCRYVALRTDMAVPWVLGGLFFCKSLYSYTVFNKMDTSVWKVNSGCLSLKCGMMYTWITYHNVGMLALFLHDVTDIQLEFTKLNVYLKTRNNTYHRLNNILSNIGCITFAVSWFVFRLYWFPLKVLYATCVSSMQTVPDIPFYFFFNCLLFTIALMNLYWFSLILMFVMKVVTGRITEVDDVREYDIELKKAEMRPAGGDASNKNHYIKGKTF
uniref:Ceramide synthase 1 n=1 Tax=Petromyzon marinus TaxID=7757 RepID=S4RZW2_PETMA